MKMKQLLSLLMMGAAAGAQPRPPALSGGCLRRRLYSDLFLLSEFKFMNFGESPFRFFADSICMMILFAVLGWGLKKGTERLPVFKTKQS